MNGGPACCISQEPKHTDRSHPRAKHHREPSLILTGWSCFGEGSFIKRHFKVARALHMGNTDNRPITSGQNLFIDYLTRKIPNLNPKKIKKQWILR